MCRNQEGNVSCHHCNRTSNAYMHLVQCRNVSLLTTTLTMRPPQLVLLSSAPSLNHTVTSIMPLFLFSLAAIVFGVPAVPSPLVILPSQASMSPNLRAMTAPTLLRTTSVATLSSPQHLAGRISPVYTISPQFLAAYLTQTLLSPPPHVSPIALLQDISMLQQANKPPFGIVFVVRPSAIQPPLRLACASLLALVTHLSCAVAPTFTTFSTPLPELPTPILPMFVLTVPRMLAAITTLPTLPLDF